MNHKNPFTNSPFGSSTGEPSGSVINIDKDKLLKRVVRTIVTVFLILVALIALMSSIVITYPNQYNLILQFGRIVDVRDTPGLSFKIPILQSQRLLSGQTQLYDLPISDVITKDKKTMVADSFALWRITDPIKFSQTLNSSVTNAEARISAIVYNSMKNVISSLTQTEIISGRDQLALAILENIGDSLDQYGVTMVAVETKHLDLPDDNKNAVYERMISERNNIAASYQAQGESEAQKIRTETDASITIQISEAQAQAAEILAEGEAEYMRILAAAYDDPDKAEFYAFVRALDAAKAGLTNKDNVLILSSDSPLTQIFYND